MLRVSIPVMVLSAIVVMGILAVVTPKGTSFSAPPLNGVATTTLAAVATTTPLEPPKPVIEHIPTPKDVKAVYMSQCAASDVNGLRKSLIQLADDTEINAIVVDVKDYTGTVAFPSATAEKGGTGCTVKGFRDLVKEMHEHGLYVIARVTVFQDPLYTKVHPDQAVKRADTQTVWKDRKGLSFVDVGSQPFRDYIVAIAREAVALGVDEVNFDYIRYPSDGDMDDIAYTLSPGNHAENLERFFRDLSRAMREDVEGYGPKISADLFGMVTTNEDDLGIGQVLERALPYFDYIAPMVYPSHYPDGFHGFDDPNKHVYEVIRFAMGSAVIRAGEATTTIPGFVHTAIASTSPQLYTKPVYSKEKLRPWLQDFDYGGDYGPAEVRAQIQAANDVGLTSWMLWAPSNKYTKEALKAE